MEIIWSPQALHDIESIRSQLFKDAPPVAEVVVRRILQAVERVGASPDAGRKVPEHNDPAIREVIEPPYRLIYRTRPDRLEVVSIFRATRL